MARPRSRLLDLETDDVFYGACPSDHASVAVHAIVGGTIVLLLLQLAAGVELPRAAAVCSVLCGAYCFILDREGEALLGFLCWAASGVLAARLGISTGWKVLHTFVGCQPGTPSFQATTPPPSVDTSRTRTASTAARIRGNLN